jgi:uncharacterized membrane protein required for colicin V production
MGFNWVDAGVAAFLVGGVVGGLRRGLSGELSRALIAAGCVAIVYYYSRPAANWLGARYDLSADVALLSAAAGLLLGAYIALTLIRLALAAIFSFSFKGRPEKIGGAICGLLRAALVAALLLTMLALLPHDTLHRHVAVESRIGRWVHERMHPLIDRVADRLPTLKIPGATDEAAPDESVEWMDDASYDRDAAVR